MVAAALVALACPCHSVSPRDLLRLRAFGRRRRYSRVRFWSGPTTGLWIGKLTCVNTMTTMTGPPPKGEDGRLAYSVQETARMLDILVHDHIIIGENRFFSFREEGLMP